MAKLGHLELQVARLFRNTRWSRKQQEPPAIKTESKPDGKEDPKTGVKAEAQSEPDSHTVPAEPSGNEGQTPVPEPKGGSEEQEKPAPQAEDAADDAKASCTSPKRANLEEI